ncbi:GATA zinc finger protein, putative [Candida dubliniensis CD36]|uniref:GATA zinc finger protein, putative n=1 Tax=Candida dubliniensis (strain CD36 / ATCC MYA-646 / CBS 7987 / NCPF 3949 / NRRL Y-17841) TaxID=573826 RepID=B9WL87_CANDC|nr:GATA zinc finger protein, putative [Candida dubliniensis CD36]CAX39792.1 GATA zinc finger protein, putative [Candida dubliniensis CD36]
MMSMSDIQQRPQIPTTTVNVSTAAVNTTSGTTPTTTPTSPIDNIAKHEVQVKPSEDQPVKPKLEQHPDQPSKPPPEQQQQQQQLPTPPTKPPKTTANTSATSTKMSMSGPVCGNCQTQTTPLWRRDETGQVLCNACGLFLKLHGRARPISLKTDTIKSRNRVKQNGSNSQSSKSSGANTPELKSKEGKSGKKSPKSKKKSLTNGNSNGNTSHEHNTLTPLLPATSNNTPTFKSTTNQQQQQQQSQSQSQQHQQQHHHHHNHHYLPNHVLQTHQVPLHYPSSTPTQFAPGLQRITSPLLLSTTSSSSSIRTEPNNNSKLTPIQAAAGALENMSNELGPSATFKKGNNINGVSLMNKTKKDISSISGSSSIFSSVAPSSSSLSSTSSTSIMTTNNPAPKLPSLGSKISSPSSQPFTRSTTPLQTLPPLHKIASHESSLPPLHNISNYNNNSSGSGDGSGQQSMPTNSQTGQSPINGNQDNNNNNNNNSNNNNNNNNGNNFTTSAHEVTLLKTRISELELVNDLYRTRIMELEAMEQAARLRESSMKKRLDEVMNLQINYQNLLNNGVSSQQQPPPQPQTSGQYYNNNNNNDQGSQSISPNVSITGSTTITSPNSRSKIISETTPTHQQQLGVQVNNNESIILPPLKRERTDELKDGNDNKKVKI